MKKFTRIEARVLPERNGLTNVITELVVGMTLTDDSGLSVYRDTLVSLPDPDEENFIAFEDITEDWCLPVCEKAAADGDWEASMIAEVEAALTRPVSKLFKFQESNKE
jgi:hypothetical protein